MLQHKKCIIPYPAQHSIHLRVLAAHQNEPLGCVRLLKTSPHLVLVKEFSPQCVTYQTTSGGRQQYTHIHIYSKTLIMYMYSSILACWISYTARRTVRPPCLFVLKKHSHTQFSDWSRILCCSCISLSSSVVPSGVRRRIIHKVGAQSKYRRRMSRLKAARDILIKRKKGPKNAKKSQQHQKLWRAVVSCSNNNEYNSERAGCTQDAHNLSTTTPQNKTHVGPEQQAGCPHQVVDGFVRREQTFVGKRLLPGCTGQGHRRTEQNRAEQSRRTPRGAGGWGLEFHYTHLFLQN